MIFDGGPQADAARTLKAELLTARAKVEPSFVARNILLSEAKLERDSRP